VRQEALVLQVYLEIRVRSCEVFKNLKCLIHFQKNDRFDLNTLFTFVSLLLLILFFSLPLDV